MMFFITLSLPTVGDRRKTNIFVLTQDQEGATKLYLNLSEISGKLQNVVVAKKTTSKHPLGEKFLAHVNSYTRLNANYVFYQENG